MNFSAFFNASPVVQIHTAAAIAAFCLGVCLYLLPKGRKAHRRLGVTCAILLGITSFSALFIMELNAGMWSFIHVLIPFTLIGLFVLVSALRKRNWRGHRYAGRGLIIGALFIPGLIAIAVPGRIPNEVLLG